MMNEIIAQKIKNAGNQALGISNFSSGSTMENILEWDSLKHLQLLAALEDQFDVQIEMGDAIKMISFDQIYTIINDRYVRKSA